MLTTALTMTGVGQSAALPGPLDFSPLCGLALGVTGWDYSYMPSVMLLRWFSIHQGGSWP